MRSAINPRFIVAVVAGVIAWIFVVAATVDNGWLGIVGVIIAFAIPGIVAGVIAGTRSDAEGCSYRHGAWWAGIAGGLTVWPTIYVIGEWWAPLVAIHLAALAGSFVAKRRL